MLIAALAALSCSMMNTPKDENPQATFSQAYQAAHRNRISVLVPEAYEMVNVALALAPSVASEPDRIPRSEYSSKVFQHFAAMREHPFVKSLDDRVKRDPILSYIDFKLNAYAFEFDSKGHLVASPTYHRITDGANPLKLLLPQMQDFATKSRFRDFYAENRGFYQRQIDFFTEDLDAPDMIRWLKAEFPQVHAYDSIKIVLSPLAGNIQNAVSLEDGCFRELQTHVNIPTRTRPDLSQAGNVIWQGTQLFGELNHGFINPTAEPLSQAIDAAIIDRADWTSSSNASAYPDDQAVFNEYMNFALISLYHDARMSTADAAIARKRIDLIMTEQRGFPRFSAFNAMLRELYASRRPGQTLAELYPQIIEWVARQGSPGR